jgi:hypothetical protein
MNKLTKKDKYSIRFLHQQGSTEDYIAKDLGLEINQVKRFISKNLKIIDEQSVSDIEQTKTDKTKNLMIRQTSAKKTNTVSIMTQGASQVGDEFYKSVNASPKNTDSYIYRRS